MVAGLVCSLAWHVEVYLDMTTFSAGLDPNRSVLCWILNIYLEVCSVWHLGTVIKQHRANPLYRTVMICLHSLNGPCVP